MAAATEVPACAREMGCLCCYHARGGSATCRCNADEGIWPCRFCWAYFPDGGFQVNAVGDCDACDGTGIHPGPDGDPSQDEDFVTDDIEQGTRP